MKKYIFIGLFFFLATSANAETYTATVKRVIDGDTVETHLLIDTYFKLHMDVTIRLARINCPEVTGEEKTKGLKVKTLVTSKLPVGTKIALSSLKKDKYGRTVAELAFDGINLNDFLLQGGFCEEYVE